VYLLTSRDSVARISAYLINRWEDGVWDPEQYQRFSDLRARPFFELLARVAITSPRYVLDFGCGPGNLTAALARRWPAAEVVGVDNSEQMLKAAQAMLAETGGGHEGAAKHGHQDVQGGPDRRQGTGSLRFQLCDVREFEPARPPDVIVSNAALQWIPDHRDLLLPRWAGMLAPGGWLAIQLPANFDQPAHQILHELARSEPWREWLAKIPDIRLNYDPADYLEVLADAGCEADAWETTYLHVLRGDNPVLEWYKGTAFRPLIAALPPERADEFLREAAGRLRTAYPPRGYGTVLPFRRVFAVAHRT
jgi:trans-aconitate 2-methyltransferase